MTPSISRSLRNFGAILTLSAAISSCMLDRSGGGFAIDATGGAAPTTGLNDSSNASSSTTGAQSEIGGAGGTSGPVCGNGVIEAAESCDDADVTPEKDNLVLDQLPLSRQQTQLNNLWSQDSKLNNHRSTVLPRLQVANAAMWSPSSF